jgi:hypothetical protein
MKLYQVTSINKEFFMKLFTATGIVALLLLQTTVSYAENGDDIKRTSELGAGMAAVVVGNSIVLKASPHVWNIVESKPMATYGQAVNLSVEKWIDGVKGTKIVDEDVIVLGAEKRPTQVKDWPLEPTVSKDKKIRITMDQKTKDVIVTNYHSDGQPMTRLKLDYQPSGLTHTRFASDTEIYTLNGDGEVRKFNVLTGKQIDFKDQTERRKAVKIMSETDPRFSNAVNFKGRTKFELETYVTQLNEKRAAAKLPPAEVYRVSRLTPLVQMMKETNQKINYKHYGKSMVGSALIGAGIELLRDYRKNAAYKELGEVENAPAIQPVAGRTANSTR